MKGKEIKYAIAFDANKEFKEIRIMDDPSDPLAVGQGSVYVFSQKEFKKLMESAMSKYTEPVGANMGRIGDQVTLANGYIGHIK